MASGTSDHDFDLWARWDQERRERFEKMQSGIAAQLRQLAVARESRPLTPEGEARFRALERESDLLDLAREWVEERYMDPRASVGGDLPPGAMARLNYAAHRLALAMFDHDDGKAFRDLLAQNAFATHLLKEVVMFQGDLLQAAIHRETRALRRLIFGLGTVGSILAAGWRWL